MQLQKPWRNRREVGLLWLGGATGLMVGVASTVLVVLLNPGPAHVHTVSGWAFPSSDGNQIGFSSERTGQGTGYDITGAAWAGADAVWHRDEGGPSCVGTDPTKRVRVWLDLVTVHSAAGTIKRVEAIRCAD